MKMSIEEKIEEDLKHCSFNGVKYSDYVKEHYISKDQYEERLKADMAAMLTEILLECEENTVRWYVGRVDGKSDDVVLIETLNEIIQQKINALRGNEDGEYKH